MSRPTAFLLLTLSSTVYAASDIGAWPTNTKKGCVLKNKRDNYAELTKTCSDADKLTYCSSGGDPASCAACETYDAAAKPFPALTQCYKFNQKACCTSGHDATIKDSYSGLLSNTCLREFPNLEYFYCLGCSDAQATFVDVDRKVVHVCPSFSKQLWDDVDYDRCGLNLGTNAWPFVLPRIEYPNSTIFLNHQKIKPPYFRDYDIVVDDKDNENCFKSSMASVRASVSMIVVVLMGITVSSLL